MKTNLFVVMLLCVCLKSFAQCDESCCATSPAGQAPAGVMLFNNHQKGEWMFSYRYMNMMMDGSISGTKNVSDNQVFNQYIMSPDKMMMNMHMVMAMYGISNKFTLMGMFNYNTQTMSMNMFPSSSPQMKGMEMPTLNNGQMIGSTSGISDTKLYAIYKLINKKQHIISLTAGVSLPTGNINVTDNSSMNQNKISSYVMQLGSGSFELLPGITYIGRYNSFYWGAQGIAIVRLNDNAAQYRLGNELNFTSWSVYKWHKWFSNSVRAEYNFTNAITGFDNRLYSINEPSSNANNSGGEKISAYIGANFYVKSRNKFSVEYGIPVYQNVNGIQMKQQQFLYAGWQITF